MSALRRSTDLPKARRRRARTLAWGLLGAAGFAGLVVLAVLTVSAQSARVDDVARLTRQINAQRRESLVIACRKDRAKNRAIIGYLADLGARPDALLRARRFFPIHQDCLADARSRTRTP